ncbi:MAG: hypothetical protein D6793_01270 [Thermoflexia bacterium]|nr:MAG: hypothetical protein D6793_01270 [Thermoflexia bacterium]
MTVIAVECNADRSLLEVLGVPRRRIRHAGNRGEVCNFLARGIAPIGLIEADPHDPSGLPRLLRDRSLKEISGDLQVYQGAGWTVIVLYPRLEEWVLKAAEETGVDPTDFGLPDNANALHRQIRTQRRQEQFQRFLRELLEAGSTRLLELRNCLGLQGKSI